MKSTTHSCTLMEKFRSFHDIVEASFLFLCIANAITVYNKHLATIRTEQATFSKKTKRKSTTPLNLVDFATLHDLETAAFRTRNTCIEQTYLLNIMLQQRFD